MLTFKSFQTSAVLEFLDPDNGHVYTAKTRTELIKYIVSYRQQNRLETIENLDVVVDNYLCSLPQNVGKCRPLELKRGILQYFKGGIALIKNIFYGEENMVSQEEADRRALICKDCIFNQFPDRDKFIQWSDDIALHSVGERRSKYHDLLGNCLGCSCPLRAKVWYKGEHKLAANEEYDMNIASRGLCWQIKKHGK